MRHVVELDGPVTGFAVTEQHIDCMCGRELIKVRKPTGEILCRKEVFEKEGLSRKLAAEGGEIFIYDFCTLYAVRQEDFELVGKWQLGSDLSSDICGMAVDKDRVYCSIRNGKLITLDRRTFAAQEFVISGSSMWSIKIYREHLVCGTVDGRLLLLRKENLAQEKELVLGKKNIASLCVDGETVYAAGQDGKLFQIGLGSFAVEALAKKAHGKMFRCAGLYGDLLVTVSYPCSEIALWRKDTLEKVRVLTVPLRLSGQACMEGEGMYIASRNIMGIDWVPLGGTALEGSR